MIPDIETIVDAVARAEAAFDTVREIGDAIAVTLAGQGQPELQARLRELRARNDADRARRAAKLAEWAGRA